MTYLVIYSSAPLPNDPLGAGRRDAAGVIHKSGPFRSETDAIRDAHQIRRILPGYRIAILLNGQQIMDDPQIHDLSTAAA